MKTKPEIIDDGTTVTVRVPISIRRRGGRRLVLAPDGTEITAAPIRRHIDNALVKAIARAFRWREMLESGTHATIAEIAAAEKINETYVGRVLRLSLLAPNIIEAILNGRHPEKLQRERLLRPFPVLWTEQQAQILGQGAVLTGIGSTSKLDRRRLCKLKASPPLNSSHRTALEIMARKKLRPSRLRFEKKDEQRLTHYLFRYPAKFHPPVAAALVEKFSRRGDTVLDPFCGSATLLVEARVRGRDGVGLDIDPVATFIADVKTRHVGVQSLRRSSQLLQKKLDLVKRSPEEYERLQFKDISLQAFSRQVSARDLTIPPIPNLFHWFRKYVVVDLATIRKAIMRLRVPSSHKQFFLACFCSIIRNVSNADPVPVSGLEVTSHMKAKDKKGRIIDPFSSFAATLARALSDRMEFETAIRSSQTKIRIRQGDATKLKKYVRRKVDAVITSPPYHNAVDYYRRHTLEMYWLGFVSNPNDRLALLPKYIGRARVPKSHPFLATNQLESWFARRCESMMRKRDKASADAFKHYAIAMKRSFAGLADILQPQGRAVFVLGKSSWNGRRLPTVRLFEELAAPHFRLVQHYWYPLRNRYMTYSRRNGANIDRDHVLVFSVRRQHS